MQTNSICDSVSNSGDCVVAVEEGWNSCENAVFLCEYISCKVFDRRRHNVAVRKKKTYYLLRCIVLIRWVVRIVGRVPKFALLSARGRINHKRCG